MRVCLVLIACCFVYANGQDPIELDRNNPTETNLKANEGVPNSKCPAKDIPNKTTFLPYPGDCTKYYRCNQGLAYPIDCPNSFEWSVSLGTCTYPKIAQCNGTSVTPTKPTSTPSHSKPTPTQTEPPPDVQCPPGNNVVIGYPGDCSKYVLCWNGIGILMTCPSGLQWNKEKGSCDWPSNANCNASTPVTPTTPKPTTSKPVMTCPSNVDPKHPVSFAYPGDCTRFYKCFNGMQIPMCCPSGLEFSAQLERCEWPCIAKCHACNSTVTPTPTTPPTTTPTPTPSCKPTNGNLNCNCPLTDDPSSPVFLPHPGDCTKYFKCFEGFAYPMNCSAGLEWSSQSKQCDWPWIAECTTSIICEGGVSNDNCPINENPNYPTHLPNLKNCTQFYKCSNGVACPMDCPKGLEWSVGHDRCEWPDVAQCCYTETTKPPTAITPAPITPAPITPAPITPAPITPAPITPAPITPAPITPAPITPAPITPAPITPAPITPAPITPAPTPVTPPICDGAIWHEKCSQYENPVYPTVFSYPGDYTKYYKCVNGRACPMDCPNGYVWNPIYNRCDWQTTAAPNPTPSPVTTPNANLQCTDLYMKYPGDCARYYQCSNGVPTAMNCPKGLLWNSNTKLCDYPRNVNC